MKTRTSSTSSLIAYFSSCTLEIERISNAVCIPTESESESEPRSDSSLLLDPTTSSKRGIKCRAASSLKGCFGSTAHLPALSFSITGDVEDTVEIVALCEVLHRCLNSPTREAKYLRSTATASTPPKASSSISSFSNGTCSWRFLFRESSPSIIVPSFSAEVVERKPVVLPASASRPLFCTVSMRKFTPMGQLSSLKLCLLPLVVLLWSCESLGESNEIRPVLLETLKLVRMI